MADGITEDRVSALMELAGRCVLRYQRIEHAMKLLIPHMVVPGTEPTNQAPNWRELLDARYTLGPLMERFKRGLKSEKLEDAHTYLEGLVNERNDLVHHFFAASRPLSGSPKELENGILELKRRLENARPLEETLLSMVGEFARELELSQSTPIAKGGDCVL